MRSVALAVFIKMIKGLVNKSGLGGRNCRFWRVDKLRLPAAPGFVFVVGLPAGFFGPAAHHSEVRFSNEVSRA